MIVFDNRRPERQRRECKLTNLIDIPIIKKRSVMIIFLLNVCPKNPQKRPLNTVPQRIYMEAYISKVGMMGTISYPGKIDEPGDFLKKFTRFWYEWGF